MKIDCSLAVNYSKERNRLCSLNFDCSTCPINSTFCPSSRTCDNVTEEIVIALQKWSDEHPQMTRNEWYKNTFPKSKFSVCIRELFGDDAEPECMSLQDSLRPINESINCEECCDRIMDMSLLEDKNAK